MSDTSEVQNIKWPGINTRLSDDRKKYQFGSNITAYTSDERTTTYQYDTKKLTSNLVNEPITMKMMRKNNAICYQVGDGPVQYIHTQPENIYPFDTPLYFGSSYKWEGNTKVPIRMLNAKMSNMTIRLGEDVDDMLADCHE